ncbi:hypothetical protein FACS1894188_11760 [Clostridia bacterium]|nr:hypothetical protein FACS1894188_11760 [Clostridia bacterium]
MDIQMMLVIDLLIIIDVFILVILGMFFQHITRLRINKIIGYSIIAVRVLLDENEDLNNLVISDDDMVDFYTELKAVAEMLRERENNRKELLNIANSIAVNIDLSALLEDLLPKVIKATNSTCAAFYLANAATNKLEIKSSIGFSKNIYGDFDMNIGEGIMGSVTNDVKIIKDIPEDSVYIIRTYLGKIKPKSMMIIPIIDADRLVGVLTLASIYNYEENQSEIIELIRYYIGISIGNAVAYEQTKRLTNELKFQNTLIQNLNEELEKKIDNRTVFLNNIIDSIKDYALYALDTDNIITAWNKGAEQILGYEKEEIIGQSVEHILSESDIKKNIIKTRIETATRDGRYEESGWKVKKDGTSYFAEMSLFPMYDNSNNIVGFTNVIKDVTYLKNVEKALGYEKEFTQKIFETSQQAVIMSNQSGIITMANEKAEKLLGESGLQNRDLCDFFVEAENLRRSLVDVAKRYGRGGWCTILKSSKAAIEFNAYMLMESGKGDPKLFLYLTEVK